MIKLIVIDSFCGAGGVTEGFHRATINGEKCAKVIIGINHDPIAIASHAANHPDTVHFVEDFTTLDPNKLIGIVAAAKEQYPNAKVLFHASAECTHHSKAKGGLPRDADSRSLPEHIERYVQVLHPDIISVENVVEFIDWGPLDENGKPVKAQKGIYYNAWRDTLIGHGYTYQYARLNAADYGAYTSRVRYFGIFAKDNTNIAFPKPTHAKNGANGLLPWKPVKDVLELDIEGDSIFNRSKPLVDATLMRIIAGLERFVLQGNSDFMLKYNSMSQRKTYKAPSVDEPCPTISCQSRIGVVRAHFLSQAYSGRPADKNFAIDRPAKTITTVDHHQMVTAYYGHGYNSSVDEPCGTLTTKDRFALVTSRFFDEQYGNGRATSIQNPCGTLTTNPKQSLVSAHWLLNPQYSNKGASIKKPCFTLIARMDKMPPYLVTAKNGSVQIKINDSDTATMRQLKEMCNTYSIVDICMRMLLIDELLRIQGFGDNYKLKGTKADMKKFIGNAVECTQAQVLAEAISNTI